MIFPAQKKIAREFSWHRSKASVFGLYNKYFFIIGNTSPFANPQFKYIIVSFPTLEKEAQQRLANAIESKKHSIRYSVFEVEEATLYLRFHEFWRYTSTKTLLHAMDILSTLFQELYIPTMNCCSVCSTTRKIDYYVVDDMGMILCDKCTNDYIKEYEEEQEIYNTEEKNYRKGFAGALLFSLPGIIIWVVLALLADRIAGLVVLLTIYWSTRGYYYFKARHGKYTKYIILSVVVLNILLSATISVISTLLYTGLSAEQIFEVCLKNDEIHRVLIGNIIIGLLIGCIVWLGVHSQYNQKITRISPAVIVE